MLAAYLKYDILKITKKNKFKFMGEYFKKYTGGLALMFSVLLLLIGVTKYDQLLTEFKYDTLDSIEYVKTAISQNQKSVPLGRVKFNIDDNGEIMRTTEIKDGTLTYHYRVLPVPQLEGNYEAFPKLELEIIDGDQKEMMETEIYKIDREKGLIYFLLKVEKNRQVALTNIYTGDYDVTLVE
jgi:hypothetical protein